MWDGVGSPLGVGSVKYPCGKGRLGLGETALGPSPRAGSVASFRSSEGGVYGRCRSIALRGPDPVGWVVMSRPEKGDEPADPTSRNSALEAARDILGLTVPEVWIAYFGLGGNLLPAVISAALSGDQELGDHDYDRVVQALNDHFVDLDQGHPVAYSYELPPAE